MRLVAIVALPLLGCSFERSGAGSDEGLVVDSGDDTTVTPATDAATDTIAIDTAIADTSPLCKAATGGSPCARVPAFAGAQVVDGVGDEFCALDGVTWDNSAGEYVAGGPVPDAGKVRVRMKLGWSSFGLSAFVEVDDPIVLVDEAPTTLWRGDSVELYLSGSSTLTGRYDGIRDPGAEQIVISPPTPGSPAQSQIFLDMVPRGPLDVEKWAAVRTKTGYAVEVRIPWSDLQGVGVTSGAAVGFDVAVNSKWDPAVEHVYSVWKRKTVALSTCVGEASPACDDRTWCTPTLE